MQTRQSVREMAKMIQAVHDELRPLEEQWGVQFHEFGFSTFSPSPETLEITQLSKLAEEKLHLYQRFREAAGLSEDAAVALISGAVMAVRGETAPPDHPAGKATASGAPVVAAVTVAGAALHEGHP